ESAARLCEADNAAIHRPQGESWPYIASYGLSREYDDYMRAHLLQAGRGTVLGRTVLARQAVHVHDVLADVEDTMTEARQIGGFRTVLGVPLLREGMPIGVIMLTRSEVQPFTEKQIELLTMFADQAVIAIENVRLFDEVQARTRELSESLEQQTATAEVLRVISSSTGELEPRFQGMLENAAKLCEASYGIMWLCEGDAFRLAAFHGDLPAAYTEQWGTPFRPSTETALARVAQTRRPVHIADLREDRSYLDGGRLAVAGVEVAGIRTFFAVPMLKENELVGVIAIYRREMRPFTDKQIDLVTNFAAQAVIAIENTRLLNELRESLEQQTVTSEILGVIAASPTNIQPVLEAIAESSCRLCEAYDSVIFLR